MGTATILVDRDSHILEILCSPDHTKLHMNFDKIDSVASEDR